MSFTLRLGSIIAVLVLVLTACAAPGATTRPATPGPATPGAATPAPTTPAATAEATPDAATPDPNATPAPTPTPPPATAGTLTLWVDETRAPIMIALGQEFTAATNVPVQVHQVGFGDIRTGLVQRGPNGQGPDVIIGAHDWLGELVDNGVVEALDLGDKAASVDPVALEAFTYDGTLYGLPYASEAIALYYNTEMVPTPPTTWDELIQMATDLQADAELDLEQAFVLQEKDPYHSYPILTANGGYIFGETEAGYDPQDVGLDSEGGIAYANQLGSMVEDGLLRAGVNYDTMISLFSTSESAMFMTGPWALEQVRDSGVPYAVAPIPAGSETARPFVGVQGVMVSAFAPNKLLAESFVTEYVATEEVMADLFEAGQRPSTWTSVADATTDEDVLAFIESSVNGDPLPAIPEMSAVWTAWTNALDFIFTGAQEPEAAVTDAAEIIRDTIANPPTPAP